MVKKTDIKASADDAIVSAKDTALEVKEKAFKTWGRAADVQIVTNLLVLGILTLSPLLVIYFYAACNLYQCSLTAPIQEAIKDRSVLQYYPPTPSLQSSFLYAGWVIGQGILYATFPSEIGYGQLTPAGFKLPYKVNGLRVWILTHVAYVVASFIGLIDPGLIKVHWPGLLVAANVYGFTLTTFAFIKAHYFPTHAADRKFSGSTLYDYFMGIELNPRLGELWDFKLFHNGRPGIVAWTLINLSFAAAQYQKIGYVTKSLVLVNLTQALYVVDFFYNEDWYLRTIDIAHDHFGFYLAWGDMVWLPFMYTVQAQYCYVTSCDLSWPVAIAVGLIGVIGYTIFRGANHQKDIVRATGGECKVWGKKPIVVRAKYTTSDGKQHDSILLASGYWGLAHQFNYVGDLLISFSMCAACGWDGNILPYFYVIYMFILLNHRIFRSEQRCRNKYGEYWDEYCKIVPWKLCPYLY